MIPTGRTDLYTYQAETCEPFFQSPLDEEGLRYLKERWREAGGFTENNPCQGHVSENLCDLCHDS